MDLTPYTLIARSLVQLLHPLVEVVIHDLPTGTIAFIAGSLSKRQVGDSSLLETTESNWEEQLDEKVYAKLNWDGRLIKSISIPLKEENQTVALMCINCDTTVFHQLKHLTDQFFEPKQTEQPQCLFKNDWQMQIHQFLHQTLADKGLVFHSLTANQKKELVHLLYTQGAFSEKKAADYIANILDMGRATIFNYLREWRKTI